MSEGIVIDIYMSNSNRYFHGFTRFLRGAIPTSSRYGIDINIVNLDSVPIDEYVVSHNSYPERFVLVMGVNIHQEKKIVLEFKRSNIPFIIVNMNSQTPNSVNILNMNHTEAAIDITNHLISNGRKNLAFLGYNIYSIPDANKLVGYQAALVNNGLDFSMENVFQYGDIGINEAIDEFLKKRKLYDGVICSTDAIAILLMSPKKLGHAEIPQELSVVGFDNLLIGKLLASPLTSVSCNFTQVGAMAIRVLSLLIDDKHIRNVNVIPKHEIIVRDSCGAKLNPPTVKPNLSTDDSGIITQLKYLNTPIHQNPLHSSEDMEAFFDEDINAIELLESFFCRINPLQAKILRLMLSGYVYKEIASSIFLSEIAVKNNVRKMKNMLNVESGKNLQELIRRHLNIKVLKRVGWEDVLQNPL